MLFSIILSFYIFHIFANTYCPNPTSNNDNRSKKNELRYVQYNAEWLFVNYCSPSQCPGSGCTWKNTTEALIHLDYVVDVIMKINPDIMNICEIESCDELNMLIENIANDKYNPYMIKGTDTSTGQNVGILTKIDPNIPLYRTEERVSYPIPNSSCGYTGDSSTTGVSKHYITEIVIENIKIAIIGLHLIAYPTDVQRCAQREAQAQVIQNIIIKYISSGYEILVSGDLNDFDAEIMDANNNTPISSVLDIFKGFSGIYKKKYELHSVNTYMQKSMIYSDWWDKNGDCKSVSTEFSMIDHILVSPYLFEHISNVYMYQEYAEFCGTYNSDHYPLIVDFIF
jgi:exonuclease III